MAIETTRCFTHGKEAYLLPLEKNGSTSATTPVVVYPYHIA